uniref:intermembrane phospholipid transport protein YdbH family protein n=1 Tax=Rheinheimera sp. TaxID=1869214 RepID=UPI0040474BBC
MRRWQKILLTAFALLLVLAAAVYWALQQALATLSLHNLHYQISSVSLRQLQLSHVSFSLEQPQLQVQLTDISINWQLLNSKITRLQLGSAEIRLLQWPQTTAEHAASQTAPAFPANWQVPANFPDNIDIDQLALQLPCADSDCRYLLSASVSNLAQQLQYRLTAADAASPTQPRLTLSGDYRSVQQLPLLNMQLQLDNSSQLQLHQQLSSENGFSANGELTLVIAPPSPWLLQQLALWQLEIPAQALAGFTTPVSVRSSWQLQLPDKPTLADISSHANGNWQLQAELPAPLMLPGIGQLQGRITATLGLEQGELSRYQLDSQLQLLQPMLPNALLRQGINADVLHISLTADGQDHPQLTALPLQLALRTEGSTTLSLTGAATVNLTPPLSAQLRHGNLELSQAQLTPGSDSQLTNLTLQSQFNAYWLADSWQLDLQTANASIAKLNTADITAHNISLHLDRSRFNGDKAFTDIQLSAEPKISLSQLTHSTLNPLDWQWQAKVSGNLARLELDGRLTNSASLGINHQLHYTADNTQLNWQLEDIFLLAGNPLSATLVSWPALLEVNRGRLAGSGELTLLPSPAATAKLSVSGVSGIYDRSLFRDLTAPLQLQYQGNQLQLSTTAAKLAEINHGIIAGPLTLTAQYQANTSAITAGTLAIAQLQLQAMGGQVQLQPQVLDLALAEQRLQLELKQIDVSQLLAQHPSTDISGNGRISGTIPLLLSRRGISVEHGFIAAESPGGKLQYRPPTAQSMAATNPGMKVVLQALDDFHYSVLSSNVNYDTNGKLLLALQLQGSNPALEAGRPINLTVNLEEDIPALITSLQLSSQISDKIKQRVQQRLQQQGVNNANGAQP